MNEMPKENNRLSYNPEAAKNISENEKFIGDLEEHISEELDGLEIDLHRLSLEESDLRLHKSFENDPDMNSEEIKNSIKEIEPRIKEFKERVEATKKHIAEMTLGKAEMDAINDRWSEIERKSAELFLKIEGRNN